MPWKCNRLVWGDYKQKKITYKLANYLNKTNYKGHCDGLPSTSNALESKHRHIKAEPLLQQAKPLKQFLEISKFMIRNWSLDYKPDYYNIQNNTKYNNPNLKSFAYYPDYTEKVGYISKKSIT